MTAGVPRPLPAGLWAVASGLDGAAAARTWAAGAAAAAAWSFRLPGGSERAAVAALRALRDGARYLAVHARADWAAAAGADAVIGGARSLPAAELAARARAWGLALGWSTHAPREVAAAAAAGARFVLFGPVWETPSKRGILAPRGLAALRAACALRVPVIAIGGIDDPVRAQACCDAGAHGVAVVRAARDPAALAALVAAWPAAGE